MTRPEAKGSRTRARLARQVAAIVLAIGVWHLFAIGPGRAADVPTPGATLRTGLEMARTADYWTAIGNTLLTANLGLLLSVVVGVPLGLFNGASRKVALSSQFVVDFGRTIPGVAILPLVLLLFGGTRVMALILVMFGAVWPMLVQATYAVQQVPPQLRQVGEAFHLTLRDRIRTVYLPSAMPFLTTGLRIAATISLLLAISAEFLGGTDGIGRNLFNALTVNNPDEMFVYAFTASLLGVALNLVLLAAQRRILWWHPSQRERG
ncbi:ABC transporter permease [Terrabacter aerolatus]|uniref:Nitrate ABC transporter permease n=1 Tax=Terrabacter aerolatus TaxID=422442 RepID=A0A512D4X8_9MICO|nr:nitrate ABC transporter permease [Terrabacter aerolatus]